MYFHRLGILTEANQAFVLKHPNPYELDAALIDLLIHKILNQEYFECVVKHANPENQARVLINLSNRRMLRGENRTLVAQNDHPISDLHQCYHPHVKIASQKTSIFSVTKTHSFFNDSSTFNTNDQSITSKPTTPTSY